MPNRPNRAGRRSTRFTRETTLLRKAGTGQERRSVLIVTNGNRTEVDYFEALRAEPWVTADKVRVKFEPGEPGKIVARTAAIRDANEYDEAWVVCDKDEFDVRAAEERADTESTPERPLTLALSVPCFEVWLILHMSDGCPGFNNAAQVSAHLKKLIVTWDKRALNFDDFRAGVPDAVSRAKRLGDPPDAIHPLQSGGSSNHCARRKRTIVADRYRSCMTWTAVRPLNGLRPGVETTRRPAACARTRHLVSGETPLIPDDLVPELVPARMLNEFAYCPACSSLSGCHSYGQATPIPLKATGSTAVSAPAVAQFRCRTKATLRPRAQSNSPVRSSALPRSSTCWKVQRAVSSR